MSVIGDCFQRGLCCYAILRGFRANSTLGSCCGEIWGGFRVDFPLGSYCVEIWGCEWGDSMRGSRCFQNFIIEYRCFLPEWMLYCFDPQCDFVPDIRNSPQFPQSACISWRHSASSAISQQYPEKPQEISRTPDTYILSVSFWTSLSRYRNSLANTLSTV